MDLSRKRLDYCLLDQEGGCVETGAAPPDVDGLDRLARRLGRHGQPIDAAIESMTGARFVHDRLEEAGLQVEIADAAKVKGLARSPARRTRSTPGSWPSSPDATSSRPSGSPTRRCRPSASGPASVCTWCASAPRSRTACTPRS